MTRTFDRQRPWNSFRSAPPSRFVRLRVDALERRDLLALFLDPVVSGSILDKPRDGIGDAFEMAVRGNLHAS